MVTAGVLVLGSSLLLPSLTDSIVARKQGVFAETAPLQSEKVSSKATAVSVATVFAKLYVPRFGARYVHAVAEGTSLNKVLNRVGIGHYQSTQMPGENGNFALAGHRAGNGGPFRLIDTFKDGDLAYVETADTWYTYRYLQTKVVKPSAIGVIYPRPVGLTASSQADSFLTLTSCTPIHVNTDRIVAWFELVEQHSKQQGPPAKLSWVKK